MTTTTTTDAARALQAQGVAAHVAAQLADSHPVEMIGAWCEYTARHRRLGPGFLVNAIRYGEPPPGARRRPLFEP